jgi:hypothetical protein
MAATKITRAERELKIREFVQATISETGLLPTVARAIEACGGSTSTVAPILREYRVPHASRVDEKRAGPLDPVAALDMEEYCRKLQDALDFARKVHPLIRAGGEGSRDSAADIRQMRDDRQRAISPAGWDVDEE